MKLLKDIVNTLGALGWKKRDISPEEKSSEVFASEERPSEEGTLVSAAGKRKYTFLIVVVILVVVVIGLVVAYFSFFKNSVGNSESVFGIFKKSELVGAASGINKEVWLGNLRITLFNATEGTYRPLELDEFGKRVTKGYFDADIEVYNSDLNTTDFLLYGLTDDLGNEYERDFEVEFYLDDVIDLGVADNYIPQTLRRGHLLFPSIDEKANKLELTVYSKAKDQKILFEIPLNR